MSGDAERNAGTRGAIHLGEVNQIRITVYYGQCDRSCRLVSDLSLDQQPGLRFVEAESESITKPTAYSR